MAETTMQATVLVVDDERLVRWSLRVGEMEPALQAELLRFLERAQAPLESANALFQHAYELAQLAIDLHVAEEDNIVGQTGKPPSMALKVSVI